MNKSQKVLTLICLGLFVLTLIRFPWDTKESYHEYAVLWFPPHNAIAPNWPIVWAEWIPLGIVYVALFFVLRKKS